MRTLDIRLPFLGAILVAPLMGCALAVMGSFSPVRGPLAETKPVPNYSARMVGALSGQITVSLPRDGSCTGTWSLRGIQPQSFDLSEDWDLIYGTGYHSAHVLGVREFVRTTLACTSRSKVRMELSNETNTRGKTRGVAEDDHGNVFKVSVYN